MAQYPIGSRKRHVARSDASDGECNRLRTENCSEKLSLPSQGPRTMGASDLRPRLERSPCERGLEVLIRGGHSVTSHSHLSLGGVYIQSRADLP